MSRDTGSVNEYGLDDWGLMKYGLSLLGGPEDDGNAEYPIALAAYNRLRAEREALVGALDRIMAEVKRLSPDPEGKVAAGAWEKLERIDAIARSVLSSRETSLTPSSSEVESSLVVGETTDSPEPGTLAHTDASEAAPWAGTDAD